MKSPAWTGDTWNDGGVTPESMTFSGLSATFTYNVGGSPQYVFHCRSANAYGQACPLGGPSGHLSAWAGHYYDPATSKLRGVLFVTVFEDGSVSRLVDWVDDDQPPIVPDMKSPAWVGDTWSESGVTPETMTFNGCDAEFTYHPTSGPNQVWKCRAAE